MEAFDGTRGEGEYTCATKLLPLSAVANVEKKVPLEWVVPGGRGMTREFVDYVLPLIQDIPERPTEHSLPRYARLKKILAK